MCISVSLISLSFCLSHPYLQSLRIETPNDSSAFVTSAHLCPRNSQCASVLFESVLYEVLLLFTSAPMLKSYVASGLDAVSGNVAFSRRSRVCQSTSFTKSILSLLPADERRMYWQNVEPFFVRVIFRLTRNGPFSATSTLIPSLSTYSLGAFCNWSPCISHEGHDNDSSYSIARRIGADRSSLLPSFLSMIELTSPLLSIESLYRSFSIPVSFITRPVSGSPAETDGATLYVAYPSEGTVARKMNLTVPFSFSNICDGTVFPSESVTFRHETSSATDIVASTMSVRSCESGL